MSAPPTVEPTILGTMLLPITQELQKRGFDAVEIMSHAGIDPGKLANPDWRITSSAFQGLMRRCIDLTEDEATELLEEIAAKIVEIEETKATIESAESKEEVQEAAGAG